MYRHILSMWLSLFFVLWISEFDFNMHVCVQRTGVYVCGVPVCMCAAYWCVCAQRTGVYAGNMCCVSAGICAGVYACCGTGVYACCVLRYWCVCVLRYWCVCVLTGSAAQFTRTSGYQNQRCPRIHMPHRMCTHNKSRHLCHTQ
eukprot:Lankesteria_metandrocarpae@DN4845_c0_g1_i2.p1